MKPPFSHGFLEFSHGSIAITRGQSPPGTPSGSATRGTPIRGSGRPPWRCEACSAQAAWASRAAWAVLKVGDDPQVL